jgi:hypothetical protein
MPGPSTNQPRQVLAEPKRPDLPQIASPDDVPPERSAETTTGPLLGDGFSVTRSRYWERIHRCKLLCKRTCTDTVAKTSGLSVSELEEIGAKIGAKLDSIGLPGLSAELSSKESSTQTSSSEQSQTTTFSTQTNDRCGLTHARYRLIEKFTFEYTNSKLFRKTTHDTYPVENELNVFDETTLEYILPGCCKDRDQDLQQLRKDGFVVLVVARDGSSAAVLPAKLVGEGIYQPAGARVSFQIGDAVPSKVVTQWLGLSAESEARWLDANPRLQLYQGSMEELGLSEQEPKSGPRSGEQEDVPKVSGLILGLGVGVAVGALFGAWRLQKKLAGRPAQRDDKPFDLPEAAKVYEFEVGEHRTETRTESEEGTTSSAE